MMTRVNKVLIGTDISRTASIVNIYAASPQPAAGEILVLDKNKIPLTPGSTVSDSEVIYICQGTGLTYNYVNDAGTSVLAARILKFSDPIEGKLVKGYRGSAYTAKAEKVITFAAITSVLTTGTEFVLTVVYKDIKATRGQFTKTYRWVQGTTETSQAVFNGLRAAIAADSGARIAGSGTTTLILTGLPIPECTTGLTDIDKFEMVEFDAFLTYISSGARVAVGGGAKTYTTYAEYGSGTWELVRDSEKEQLGYEGVMDQFSFPQVSHSLSTVKSETYDTVIIEHDRSYLSPDNQYVKEAPMTTTVFIPNTATANQMADVLGVLNVWMASCPGNFNAVNF